MATINATYLSLQDHLTRLNPDGSRALIIDRISKTTSAIRDMPFREGNVGSGYQFTNRSKLPAVNWRVINEGVVASKSATGVVTETAGRLSGMSRVDVELAELGGDPAAVRADEDAAFVPAMEEEIETGLFYHSTKTNPEKFMGLAPRLDSTSGPYGAQIQLSSLSSSGSDQTSAYLVCWGPDTVHGFFPKGTKGGLSMTDHGKGLFDDGSGSGKMNNYYTSEWNWRLGLAVKNPRYMARLANIDMSAILGTGSQLIQDLIKTLYKVKDLRTGKPVIYINRALYTFLDLQVLDTVKSGGGITFENVAGERTMFFRQVPVRMTDGILSTESIIG